MVRPPESLAARGLEKRSLKKSLRAWWKRSVFNPYYLDRRLLHEGIAKASGELRGRMIDVGCGDRPYASLFGGVAQYVGLEHPAAVIHVEEKLRTSFQRVVGLIDAFGDAAAIPFRDASFDSCLCTEVLEHVPDPGEVVREIRRVLRPGGLALFTVPFVGELHQTPYDFRRFTIFGIRRVLEDGGLTVERITPRGNFPIAAGLVLSHAIYRLGAREIRRDGAVSMRLIAVPIVSPLCAIVQLATLLIGKLSKDDGYCVGYVVLARRPEG